MSRVYVPGHRVEFLPDRELRRLAAIGLWAIESGLIESAWEADSPRPGDRVLGLILPPEIGGGSANIGDGVVGD